MGKAATHREVHAMETPFTLYKLIILYILNNSETELTNSQLSEFILDRDYTNYFHLQQAVSELVESRLIDKKVNANSSYYKITPEGARTLSSFESDISSDIKKDVKDFLQTRGYAIRNAIQTPTSYYLSAQGSYLVRCQILEKGVSLIDLNVAVPTLEAAKAVCQVWPLKYQKVYDTLMEELL